MKNFKFKDVIAYIIYKKLKLKQKKNKFKKFLDSRFMTWVMGLFFCFFLFIAPTGFIIDFFVNNGIPKIKFFYIVSMILIGLMTLGILLGIAAQILIPLFFSFKNIYHIIRKENHKIENIFSRTQVDEAVLRRIMRCYG